MCLLSFIIITTHIEQQKIIEQVIGEWAKSLKYYAYTMPPLEFPRHIGLPCRRIKHETKSCMSYNLQNMCSFSSFALTLASSRFGSIPILLCRSPTHTHTHTLSITSFSFIRSQFQFQFHIRLFRFRFIHTHQRTHMLMLIWLNDIRIPSTQ